MFWHYPHYGNQGGEPSTIIRSSNWKLIHYWEDGRDELYDISQDVGEQQDLSNAEPQVRASLRKKLDKWIEQVGTRLPQLNPKYDDKLAERAMRDTRAKRLPQLERQHAGFLGPDFKPNATWWPSVPD